MKFNKLLEQKVITSKINLDSLRPWITSRVIQLMDNVEDEILIEYILNYMANEELDGIEMQVRERIVKKYLQHHTFSRILN